MTRAERDAALEALLRELVEDARDEGYWSGCAGPELAERAARTAATYVSREIGRALGKTSAAVRSRRQALGLWREKG